MKVHKTSREIIVGTWKLEFSSKNYFTQLCGRPYRRTEFFDPLQSMVYIIVSSLKYSLGFEVHSRCDTVFALLLEISGLQMRGLSKVTEIFAKNQNARWNKKNPLKKLNKHFWPSRNYTLHSNLIDITRIWNWKFQKRFQIPTTMLCYTRIDRKL